MNQADWLEVAALVADLWPQQPWPQDSIVSSFELVQRYSREAAIAGVHELSNSGRDFAPPPGLVAQYARAHDASSRLALPEPDLIRDLTPEEKERSKRLAIALRNLLAKRGMA